MFQRPADSAKIRPGEYMQALAAQTDNTCSTRDTAKACSVVERLPSQPSSHTPFKSQSSGTAKIEADSSTPKATPRALRERRLRHASGPPAPPTPQRPQDAAALGLRCLPSTVPFRGGHGYQGGLQQRGGDGEQPKAERDVDQPRR